MTDTAAQHQAAAATREAIDDLELYAELLEEVQKAEQAIVTHWRERPDNIAKKEYLASHEWTVETLQSAREAMARGRTLLLTLSEALVARAAAEGEVERLHTRLEDNFAYRYDSETGEAVRISVEPGSIPDGIECRDETIRLLEESRSALKARADAAEARAEGVVQERAGLIGRLTAADGFSMPDVVRDTIREAIAFLSALTSVQPVQKIEEDEVARSLTDRVEGDTQAQHSDGWRDAIAGRRPTEGEILVAWDYLRQSMEIVECALPAQMTAAIKAMIRERVAFDDLLMGRNPHPRAEVLPASQPPVRGDDEHG